MGSVILMPERHRSKDPDGAEQFVFDLLDQDLPLGVSGRNERAPWDGAVAGAVGVGQGLWSDLGELTGQGCGKCCKDYGPS